MKTTTQIEIENWLRQCAVPWSETVQEFVESLSPEALFEILEKRTIRLTMQSVTDGMEIGRKAHEPERTGGVLDSTIDNACSDDFK